MRLRKSGSLKNIRPVINIRATLGVSRTVKHNGSVFKVFPEKAVVLQKIGGKFIEIPPLIQNI